MAQKKRKDSKGRILKPGESVRANGTYDYRYTDISGQRKSVYAPTLEKLRKKETEIIRDSMDGIDYSAGDITVCELVMRYMQLKCSLKINSLKAYSSPIKRLNVSAFGKRKVRTIKISDAKAYFLSLHNAGLKRNTISVDYSVLHPAFEMAVDDDIIRKNPFKFSLADLLPNDSVKRFALTKHQQEFYIDCIRKYRDGRYLYDVIILLGTGLRVSELYGLTKADINFTKRCFYVRRQLCRTADRPYFVTPPKSESGVRCIPMSDKVYEAFQKVMANRPQPKIEMMVDGVTGFLFLDKNGAPKVAMHLQGFMRYLHNTIEQKEEVKLPQITPHVLRHTFCSEMEQAGMNVKALQYLMGHASPDVTLGVYAHVDYDSVAQSFLEAVGSTQ